MARQKKVLVIDPDQPKVWKDTLPANVVVDFDVAYPIDKIAINPHNANRNDIGAIEESIQATGFAVPLVINRRTGLLVDGEHRMLAARELGFATLPVVFVDVDKAGELRLLAAVNRYGRLGADDPEALVKLLQEVQATSETELAGTGFSDDDLESLLDGLASPAEKKGKKGEGDGLPRLHWPGKEVEMTPTEEHALNEALEAWQEKNGTILGFVGALVVAFDEWRLAPSGA